MSKIRNRGHAKWNFVCIDVYNWAWILNSGEVQQVNSKEIIRMLEGEGYKLMRTKGSHYHYKHPDKSGVMTVPHPKKDLPIGTAKSILKAAGLV